MNFLVYSHIMHENNQQTNVSNISIQKFLNSCRTISSKQLTPSLFKFHWCLNNPFLSFFSSYFAKHFSWTVYLQFLFHFIHTFFHLQKFPYTTQKIYCNHWNKKKRTKRKTYKYSFIIFLVLREVLIHNTVLTYEISGVAREGHWCPWNSNSEQISLFTPHVHWI